MTICAAPVALVLAPDGVSAAPDAKECLSAPNRDAQEGQHWYFRTDHATNQKCWYVRDVATTGSVDGSERAEPDAARPAVAGPSAAQPSAAQPSAAQPSAAQASATQPPAKPSRSAAMDDHAREALFREFLRWYKEHAATQ
jgi:hypothetical protein